MASREKPPPLCVYCGVREGTTRDHVVPQCLFTPPYPEDLVTVLACPGCNNNEKSLDDTYLRDMLVMDLENDGHPLTEGFLTQKLIRSLQRNRSHLMRDVKSRRRTVPRYTPGGLYVDSVSAAPLDHVRVNRTFKRTVQGLYYRLHNARLPDDYVYEIAKVRPEAKHIVVDRVNQANFEGKYTIGNVFECVYKYGDPDPFVTWWLLRFFDVFVIVSTDQPGALPAFTPPQPMVSWLPR